MLICLVWRKFLQINANKTNPQNHRIVSKEDEQRIIYIENANMWKDAQWLREVQIKITVKYYIESVWLAKLKKLIKCCFEKI